MTCKFPGDKGAKRGLLGPLFYFLFLVSFLSDGADTPGALALVRVSISLAFLFFAWRSREAALRPNVADLLVFLFWALTGTSLVRAGYPWVAYQWFINITCVSALYLLSRVFFSSDRERFWGAGWVLLGALAAVQAGLQIIQSHALGRVRPAGTFVNPNFLAEFLLIAAVGCFYLFRKLQREQVFPRWRYAVGVAMLVALAGMARTQSRGIFLVAVIVIPVLLVREFGWRRALPGVAALLVLGMFLGRDLPDRFLGAGDPYAYQRLNMWQTAGRTVLEQPLGVGIGNFLYSWYRLRGPVEGVLVSYSKYTTNPHNEFLSVLAELGIPGGILFLGFAALLLVAIRRAWRTEDVILRGTCAMLAVSALHSLVDYNYHVVGLLTINAVLLGVVSARAFAPLGSFSLRRPIWVKSAITVLVVPVILFSLLTASAMIVFRKGESAMLRGDTGSAERSFLLARTLDPLRAVYPDSLSALYFHRFRKGEGTALLAQSALAEQDAAFLNPNSFKFALRVAFLQTIMSRVFPEFSAALLAASDRQFDKALELNPYYVYSYYLRAGFLLDVGKTREAILWMEKGLRHEPKFPAGYALIGEALDKEGREEEALRTYKRALALAKSGEEMARETFEKEFSRLDVERIAKRVDEIEAVKAKED